MSRKSRMKDLREKKDRRMKMIAIGGAVLLAVILAFEMPHYLGGSSSSGTTTTTSTTSASGTPATASGTAAAAVMPASSTKLENSDVLPKRTKSQLYSFSHFAGKDPFVSQLPSPPPASPNGGSGSSTPSSSGGSSAPSGVTGAALKPSGIATQGSAASIEVNGKVETVGVGSTFPASNPVFKLVSVSGSSVKIGISNGGFSNGMQTVSVAVGKSLTLVNKTNGRRYVLLLLSVS